MLTGGTFEEVNWGSWDLSAVRSKVGEAETSVTWVEIVPPTFEEEEAMSSFDVRKICPRGRSSSAGIVCRGIAGIALPSCVSRYARVIFPGVSLKCTLLGLGTVGGITGVSTGA